MRERLAMSQKAHLRSVFLHWTLQPGWRCRPPPPLKICLLFINQCLADSSRRSADSLFALASLIIIMKMPLPADKLHKSDVGPCFKSHPNKGKQDTQEQRRRPL